MVRVQREKIRSGPKKDKRFEGEGGGRAVFAEGGDGPSSAVEVYKPEKSEKEVTGLVGVGSSEEARTSQEGYLQE